MTPPPYFMRVSFLGEDGASARAASLFDVATVNEWLHVDAVTRLADATRLHETGPSREHPIEFDVELSTPLFALAWVANGPSTGDFGTGHGIHYSLVADHDAVDMFLAVSRLFPDLHIETTLGSATDAHGPVSLWDYRAGERRAMGTTPGCDERGECPAPDGIH